MGSESGSPVASPRSDVDHSLPPANQTAQPAAAGNTSANAAAVAASIMGQLQDPNNKAQLSGLDPQHIVTFLRHLPGVFNKLNDGNALKEAVSAVTSNQNAPAAGSSSAPPPPAEPLQESAAAAPGRKRRPETGSDEWARQRKDNHKEVERRRRGNINDGISELGRIVPNGGGEKAKGAVLSRAVQYIHQLKENEARNIEKWTLEKLLMDQAMGDLQGQLEEMRKRWERAEAECEELRKEIDLLKGGSLDADADGEGEEFDETERRPEKRQRME